MATKSFFKNVNIKTAKQAELFVNALEKAEKFQEKSDVPYTRTPIEIKSEDVGDFLKKVRWDN